MPCSQRGAFPSSLLSATIIPMVALNKTYRKTLTPDRSAKDSGHRYYSPEISRWLSLDPIGEVGGVHLYGFVGNRALGTVDPVGLQWGTGNPVTMGPGTPLFPSLPTSATGYLAPYNTTYSSPLVFNFNTTSWKCCGDTLYNPLTHCCCEETKKIFSMQMSADEMQWKGECFELTGGVLGGGGGMRCGLRSQEPNAACERWEVTVDAWFVGGEAGGGFAAFSTTMTGALVPDDFNGIAKFFNIGGGVGLDVSVISYFKLGAASDFIPIGIGVGLDVSPLTWLTGVSHVQEKEKIPSKDW